MDEAARSQTLPGPLNLLDIIDLECIYLYMLYMVVNSNITCAREELPKLGIDFETLKSDLTLPNPEYSNLVRFGKGRFYKKVPPKICYLKKSGGNYLVPRYYKGETGMYGNEGADFSVRFKFKLRDYQQTFIDNNISAINENTGILLEASCGTGKTIMAIYLSIMRGKQTMVLVPTYYLAEQWKQRIEESTDARCAILASKDKEMPVDYDFTIIALDLFTCRTLPGEFVSNIGCVVLDEAHRVGAETYIPVLDEIPAKYRIALTATFRRTDNVHKILAYHFGKHLKMGSNFPKPLVYGIRTGVHVRGVVSKNRKHERFLDFLDSIEYPYNETDAAIELDPKDELRELLEKQYAKGGMTKSAYHEISACLFKAAEMRYPTVESYLDSHSGRRKLAIRIIRECMDAGRTVLFLSKRKATLKALHGYFAEYKPMLIVSETNKRTDEENDYLQNRCPLVFGVNQLAKEGLDIDRLDTLIMHLPMVDTEQAVGRISRLHEGKKFPVAFYLVDYCPITYSVYSKAKKFFAINGEFKGERTLPAIRSLL